MIIPGNIKEHLTGPTAFWVGTRDSQFKGDIVRGIGSFATLHNTVKIFIAEITGSQTIANLKANKLISLSSTNIFTYESFQLKGRMIQFAKATKEEQNFIDDFVKNFDENLFKIGLEKGLVLAKLPHDPAIGIDFEVDQIFDQTPKMGTGKLLSIV